MEKRRIQKHTIITAFIVAFWLIVTLFALGLFNIHDGWPAFLVLLFFTEGGLKTEKLKPIFIGGAVGLALATGLMMGVGILAPVLGMNVSIFALVFVIVFLLIALGDLSHTLFNNYAFCYFTVALIYTEPNLLTWLLVLFLGGTFFVGGVIKLSTLQQKISGKNNEKAKEV